MKIIVAAFVALFIIIYFQSGVNAQKNGECFSNCGGASGGPIRTKPMKPIEEMTDEEREGLQETMDGINNSQADVLRSRLQKTCERCEEEHFNCEENLNTSRGDLGNIPQARGCASRFEACQKTCK